MIIQRNTKRGHEKVRSASFARVVELRIEINLEIRDVFAIHRRLSLRIITGSPALYPKLLKAETLRDLKSVTRSDKQNAKLTRKIGIGKRQ